MHCNNTRSRNISLQIIFRIASATRKTPTACPRWPSTQPADVQFSSPRIPFFIILKRKRDAPLQLFFLKLWGRLLILYRVPWCQTVLDDDHAEKCSLCFRPCDTRLQFATVCFAVARSCMFATGSLPAQLFVSHRRQSETKCLGRSSDG